MNKIKLLPKEEILKIAAGEVIRRPASILKELLDNAIDAGSANISVKIQKAGKKLVEVSDDGCGMHLEDAKSCVLLHATSKITGLDDLANLTTLGFRGEAMASIAAVTRLTIITKEDNCSFAYKVSFDQSEVASIEEAARERGTTISAKDLFYNIPVRQNFLKSDDTENNLLKTTFINAALAHKEISFKYFVDEKIIFNCPKTDDLRERVAALFDPDLAKQLIPFSIETTGLKIYGLTSNLELQRYNKNFIHIFVNNRAIKEFKIASSICKGYSQSLPNEKFPVTFCFVELDPSDVDVNVHPCKEEVAFKNHSQIISLCKDAIHQALNESISEKISSLKFIDDNYLSKRQDEDCMNTSNVRPSIFSTSRYEQVLNNVARRFSEQPGSKNKDESILADSFAPMYEQFQPLEQTKKEAPSELNFDQIMTASQATVINKPIQQINVGLQQKVAEQEFKIIGQLFFTYIMFQRGDMFGMIDQHAASERILYEEMKSNFENLPSNSLIFPQIIELSEKTISFLIRYDDLFVKFGIIFEQFDAKSIVVKSIPPKFSAVDLKDLFLQTEEEFSHLENVNQSMMDQACENIRKKIFEHLHSHTACKLAIKAGDQLSMAMMQELVIKLNNVDNRFQCIHGRPTIYELDKSEIEKWFRRN